MNSVRVYLALLLAAQFVVPLVPSWGAFVPHDHRARGRITPADWNAHVREHLTGPNTATEIRTPTNGTGIVSTLSHDGLNSFQAPLADHDSDLEFALAPRHVLHNVPAHEFTARVVSYPPLKPPPNI